jgi:antirestriction protein ArdC
MSTTDLSAVKFDVHRAITDKIVQAIEAGAGEFVMPWHTSGTPIGRPTNAATGAAYRGVNVVGLWAEATIAGFSSGTWASFRQWQKLGAAVRKGERGTPIVFYKMLDAGDPGASLEEDERGPRMIARASWVFNAGQVEGWQPPLCEATSLVETCENVEALLRATRAKVRYGGDVACYRLREDVIEMPDRSRFVATSGSATESHYATLLHELTHWTGAAHRLNRTFGERFKDEAYAFEELVAELGAAFLCGDLGISNEPRPDHAAYLSSWLRVLKSDNRAVFSAARFATVAADFIVSFTE